MSWWSYTVCVGRNVTQYHPMDSEQQDQRYHPWAERFVESGPTEAHYILGSVPADEDSVEIDATKVNVSSTRVCLC